MELALLGPPTAVRFLETPEGLSKEEMTPKKAVGLHLSHHLQRAACNSQSQTDALLTFFAL